MMKVILLLAVLSACGKKHSKPTVQNAEFDEDGLFYGIIYPINSSGASGTVRINKVSDSLTANVKVSGITNGSHEQYLYENSRCPIFDLNGDGEIDLGEISTQSGKRLIEFVKGMQETSYHVMLGALGKEMIDFEKRTVVVFQGIRPIGCAELDQVLSEPEEPEPPKPTYTPRRPRPGPVVVLPPPPPPEEHTSWWDRLSERLRRWWCRVRRRCS